MTPQPYAIPCLPTREQETTHWLWVKMNHSPNRDPERLAKALSASLGYAFEQVTRKTRKRPIVKARHQIMYVLRKRYKKASLKIIGDILGGFDHTSVMHGIKTAENDMATQPEYKQTIERLMQV